ncbi:hypothetical protein D6T63_06780 [Arthrobacter cheniae]|uniref:Uncharacterized protein n=1 Tax=Arthrobacter cheniae TaxID=1258888 RepID=A0A3A5MF32_9MICC|nr:hypothetical protein [Arthrobacter cheniae]RJT80902.1 hypothetical protein D6T63_06780 [Arthrobacter cheniae]
MSADSVMMPASGDSLPTIGNDRIAFDAVDTYEVTARLEASGLSDRTVRLRNGATDVFAYAQSLDRSRDPARAPLTPGGWLARTDLLEAVRRGIVLILGAVLGGLTATVLVIDTNAILIAGIGAWIIGQSVSGIVWAHAGTGQVHRGVARGTGAALIVGSVLACYLAVSLLLPTHHASTAVLTLAWCWYSCVVSMLVILGRSWYLLTVLAGAVSVMTVALVLGHDATTPIVVAAALLVLVAVTINLVAVLRTIDEPHLPGRGDVRAALAPAAQAGFLAAALSMALTRLPDWEGTALIVATVVAAAATDPALVLMRQRLVWSSHRTPLLTHAARHAWVSTLVMSTVIVVVSAVVSTLVVIFLVKDARATTVIVAAAFSSLATTSTTISAFGLPRAGVLFAGAACLSAAAWLSLGAVPAMLLAIVFVTAGSAMLLARVSDPRAYA